MKYMVNIGVTFEVEAESEDEALDLAVTDAATEYGYAFGNDCWVAVAD